MKLVQCENGHYYDSEKYPSCPHCSSGGGFGGGQQGAGLQGGMGSAGSYGGYDSVTQASPSMGMPQGGTPTVGFNETRPLYSQQSGGMDVTGAQRFAPPPAGPAAAPQGMKAAADEGKTVAYMAWNAPGGSAGANPGDSQAHGSTVAFGEHVRPVVGWLVCIEGNSYGKCYNLYGEKNFIGRSQDMDVALTDDNTVARNRHAILIYDPKAKVFYAQPGDSHELFYVNDKVVLQSMVLEDRDVLKIGKTTLVFVPFCDSRYSWTEE